MPDELLHISRRFDVRASRAADGRPVAVKRLRHADDAEGAAALHREAALLRRAAGAGLVPLLSAGAPVGATSETGSAASPDGPSTTQASADRDVTAATDRPEIVMPFEPAGDLRARVETAGPLDRDAARKLAADLFGALAAMHRTGVVHGAIRPSEILLGDPPVLIDPVGGDGEGPARDVDLFTAPEVARGGARTTAADVYALAKVCLWASDDGHDPEVAGLLDRARHEDPGLRPGASDLAASLRAAPAASARPDPAATPDAMTDATTTRRTDAAPRPDAAMIGPGRPARGHVTPARAPRPTPAEALAAAGTLVAVALATLDSGALDVALIAIASAATAVAGAAILVDGGGRGRGARIRRGTSSRATSPGGPRRERAASRDRLRPRSRPLVSRWRRAPRVDVRLPPG